MAELATAGSVVGLISLSIQCCEGLTKYYSDFRTCSEEINQMILSTEELKTICLDVERELQRLPQTQEANVQQVVRLIASCRSGIQNLKDTLGQCMSTQLPRNLPEKLHRFRVRAVYPFKKRTLQTLKDTVQNIQNNLQSALAIQQLHISVSSLATSSSTETIVRDNQTLLGRLSSQLQAINTVVPVAQRQTEDIPVRVSSPQDDVRNLREDVSVLRKKGFEDFAKLDQSIDKGTEKIENAIAKRFHEYSADMDRALALQNSDFRKQRTEIEALNQRIKSLQIGMISQPGLMRSVCEQFDQSNTFSGSYPAISGTQARPRRSTQSRGQCCGCQSRLRGSASKSYCLDFARNLNWKLNSALLILSHRPPCPLSRTYIVSVKSCGALLARAIEASITITCGAGGLSMSPVIQCLRVVSADSPAFQLVNWSSILQHGPLKSTAEFDIVLRNNISKLVLLFEAGKASAYDVDSERNTLLHKACPPFKFSLAHLAHLNQLPEISLFESLMRFYQSLIELCIPLNWVDYRGRTFMDIYVTQHPAVRDFSSLSVWTTRLLDAGAELNSTSSGKDRAENVFVWHEDILAVFVFAKSSRFLHVLSCNDLSVSVLRKSEQEVLRILEQFPQSIHQANEWGQTPLHLAVCWPLGMEILLHYGANVDRCDDFGMKPLGYAIRLGLAESVHSLMKAGCSLKVFGQVDALSFATETRFLDDFDRLRGVSVETRKIVLETFISSLAERRRDLQCQLATSLPRKGVDACWTQNDRVLDEHAPCVQEFLSSHGLLLLRDSSLLNMPTVYHVDRLTVDLAEMLWQAGFRDIDVPGRDGRTPLMLYMLGGTKFPADLECIFKITIWLIKRGANIHRWQHSCVDRDPEQAIEVTDKKPTKMALHYVAAAIGFCVGFHLYTRHSGKIGHFDKEHKLSLMPGAQWLGDEINQQSETSRECLAKILSDTVSDHCMCACSTRGCLASTIIQRTAYTEVLIGFGRVAELEAYGLDGVEVPYFREVAMPITETVITLLGSHNERQTRLANALIRFQTFQELELRHTCCQYSGWLETFKELEPDEVDEIRNEDSEGIELLEALMVEFSEKRGNQDVMTFLKGYWTTRMDEVHRARGQVDKDKLREIGVVLEEENEFDENDIEDSREDN